MSIKEASDFFEGLLRTTDKKSERKIYENFMGILSDLDNRALDVEQLESIEKELEILDLKANTDNRKRYLRKKLGAFKKYLKAQFSFVTEGYYLAIGISLGVAFGAAFGSAFNVGLGVSFGMVIGLIIGQNMDAKAKKQNLVLKTTIE